MSKTIAMLGGGAWGTAVATLLARNGHTVRLWCFEQEVADCITQNQINATYLPGIELSKNIIPTSSLCDAVTGADLIFEAVPVAFLREIVTQVAPHVVPEQPWVCLSKGIEDKTLFFPTQILDDVFCRWIQSTDTVRTAVLTGPNFARQLAQEEKTAALIASSDPELCKLVATCCGTPYFTSQCSSDLIGAQVGGALKNVISLFLGIIDGCEYHENTRAFLLTKGFGEMISIARHLGGNAKTICGLAGFGDLVLGLVGEKNRNYDVGVLFGQGNSLAEISQMRPLLPEGINTTKSIMQLIERDSLDAPVCKATHDIIFHNKSIRGFVEQLFYPALHRRGG